MTPDQRFRAPRLDRWRATRALSERPLHALSPREVGELARLYRLATRDLAVMASAGAEPRTQAEVSELVALARRRLFRRTSVEVGSLAALGAFFGRHLPRAIRRQAGYVLTAALLLILPMGLTYTLARQDPARAYAMANDDQRETARAHQVGFDPERDPTLGATASAFYITHNTNLALRAFAGGVAFGLGTTAALVYNGYGLGVTLALVELMGAQDTLYAFVATHLPWELLAIFLAGGGGLMMGVALLRPGELSRAQSLAEVSPEALTLALGSVGLLIVAGLLEGVISPAALGSDVKYLLGLGGGVFLLGYCVFMGREIDPPAPGLIRLSETQTPTEPTP